MIGKRTCCMLLWSALPMFDSSFPPGNNRVPIMSSRCNPNVQYHMPSRWPYESSVFGCLEMLHRGCQSIFTICNAVPSRGHDVAMGQDASTSRPAHGMILPNSSSLLLTFGSIMTAFHQWLYNTRSTGKHNDGIGALSVSSTNS